jgi:polar amino acid transport system substrate-binding protein
VIGRSRRRWAAAAAVVAALAAAACSQVDVPESLPGPTTTIPPQAAPRPETPGCDETTVTRSLRPDAAALAALESRQFTPGTTMAEIAARGTLRVGVDTSTLQFATVDPDSGDIEGFDVDIAREVAAALFGDRDRVELVAIPYSERVNVLVPDEATGETGVDIVVDTFTINCVRDELIDFSTEYFTSVQKLLVRIDSGITGVGDLTAGHRVCAAHGSTSIENLAALDPRPIAVGVTDQADCLVLLQQGRVDAISTDDTILAGMKAQDLNVDIVGDGFSAEPYGIGVPQDQPEMLRFVNAVLDRVRASGTWNDLYEEWLADLLGGNVTPPAAQYED